MDYFKVGASAIAAGMVLLATPAAAGTIAVNGFSFESPNVGGGYQNVCPTGWTCSPAANPQFGGGNVKVSGGTPGSDFRGDYARWESSWVHVERVGRPSPDDDAVVRGNS